MMKGLARAVAASEIPVISAVGHETDFTIVDFVADLRAPTPSAAAELVIRSRVEVETQAEAVRERLVRAMERRLLEARHALTERAQHGAFARMMDLIRQRQQKLDDLTYRLERGERQLQERQRRRWEAVAAAVRHYDARRVLAGMRGELEAQTAALAAGMRNLLLQYRGARRAHGQGVGDAFAVGDSGAGVCAWCLMAREIGEGRGAGEGGGEIRARVARGEIRATVKNAGGDGEIDKGKRRQTAKGTKNYENE
jgi:exodeoxyribonuclease VII large subunit